MRTGEAVEALGVVTEEAVHAMLEVTEVDVADMTANWAAAAEAAGATSDLRCARYL